MINLVIPIAGKAQRFIDKGFLVPKPLIMIEDKHMIDWAMDSIKYDECHLIFIVRKDHITNYSIDSVLREKFGDKIQIIALNEVTRGTLCTCLKAKHFIDNQDPLVIYTPDVYFGPQWDPMEAVRQNLDGLLLTFKANSPDHSYVKLAPNGKVIEAKEKEVISDQAAVGVYYFKHGADFVRFGEAMVESEVTTNGEFYVCPVFNYLVSNNNVQTKLVEKMHVLGTPPDLDFFVNKTLKTFGDKPIALCCDHSGFQAKQKIKEVLAARGITFIDFGTYVENDCDHYDFLSQAVRHINAGTCDFGMAFCRSGQGFNIAANKARDIRSALVYDAFTAEFAVRHNAVNFFCIPGREIDNMDVIVDNIINNNFDGGRHMTRIQKIERDDALFNN